jgi:hypothetical protein
VEEAGVVGLVWVGGDVGLGLGGVGLVMVVLCRGFFEDGIHFVYKPGGSASAGKEKELRRGGGLCSDDSKAITDRLKWVQAPAIVETANVAEYKLHHRTGEQQWGNRREDYLVCCKTT